MTAGEQGALMQLAQAMTQMAERQLHTNALLERLCACFEGARDDGDEDEDEDESDPVKRAKDLVEQLTSLSSLVPNKRNPPPP